MKLLITGAGGFVGEKLCKSFIKKYNIYKVSSNLTKEDNSFNIDLTNDKMVKELIDKLSKDKIDIIINLASKVSSPTSTYDLNILNDNILITKNIIRITKDLNPKHLINFSSMSVYPNVSGSFSEGSMISPQNNNDCLYGLSKYSSEVLIDFFLKEISTKVSHLRIAQIYGEGMREDRIIPTMLKELKDNNSITVFGDGIRTSNFIEINKLIKIVDHIILNKIVGLYNVGDQNLNYCDLAKILIEEHGDSLSKIIRKKKGSKAKFNLDVSKIEDTILKHNVKK